MRDWAREAGLAAYDQAEGTGYLRHLVYREGRNTGQVLVQLVTAPGELHDADGLVAALRRFPEVRSIHHAVNESPAEVTNLPTTLLWGEEAIEEELLGLRFRIRPNAFLQTNTAMAERLYELAVEFAALTGEETVWDLYCGIGSIGLAMARDALTVWGVDISEESMACALENAELNGIANAAFYAGDVGQAIEELKDRSGPPDIVVVDPPRAGLSGKGRAAAGADRRAADRLRLLQPDDARRGTSSSSARTGATSCARRGRSTCSRTRRTWRPSRCSSGRDSSLEPSNTVLLGSKTA